MRKFNDEILRQLIDEKWDDNGIHPEVGYRTVDSNWLQCRQVVCRLSIKKRDTFEYESLSESLISSLKAMINNLASGQGGIPDGFKAITLLPQLAPFAVKNSILRDGKIIVPNKYVWARFYGDPTRNLFWGDVITEIRIRAAFDVGTAGIIDYTHTSSLGAYVSRVL